MIKAILLAFLTSLSVFSAGAFEPLPDYSQKYDPHRDVFEDANAAIKLAAQTQRRILIELGGNWCSWCHVLDKFFKDNPALNKELHETFVVFKVNVSEANDNHKFLKVFPEASGYPHMYVTESNGTILRSVDTAIFLVNGSYSIERFEMFFKRWSIKVKEEHEK